MRAGAFQGGISTSTTRSAEGRKSGRRTSTAWPETEAPRPEAMEIGLDGAASTRAENSPTSGGAASETMG